MAEDHDIRDTGGFMPVSDQASVSPVARRQTRVLLDLLTKSAQAEDPEQMALLGLKVVAALGPLSDPDLEGVQALGLAIAAAASQVRRGKADR